MQQILRLMYLRLQEAVFLRQLILQQAILFLMPTHLLVGVIDPQRTCNRHTQQEEDAKDGGIDKRF